MSNPVEDWLNTAITLLCVAGVVLTITAVCWAVLIAVRPPAKRRRRPRRRR